MIMDYYYYYCILFHFLHKNTTILQELAGS